ncbi:mitochondrial uncoupling protein 4 isoform X1 [Alligator mississippiensis]|uniref:mitochondrial uncoupling protein 4 isoform X1 n=1 Tax=Alligator mississippiensis TaxID=8496 RepID=UPI002877F823|nr:mitochondrial uncoupling protein 4 isoform X1 [Alligator mississippiensis]
MLPPEEEKSLPLSERWPRASKFVLSACAAVVAELVTFPLDLTKTRLQIQGEAAMHRHEAAPYRGMLRTAAGIVQEEGLLKLWQGATPAVYRHIVYSGVRMVAYEHLRDSVLGRAEDKSFPLWYCQNGSTDTWNGVRKDCQKHGSQTPALSIFLVALKRICFQLLSMKAVVGGMTAGAIGQFFASPTDLVKVQMQMEGRRRLEGKPSRFRGVHHAFVKILSEGGIRGLWAGWVPNVQRAALVNMGDLTTYDSVKHFLLRNTPLQDNSVTHSMASGCSGLVAAILGTPADVVKTRIMNQPRDEVGRGLLYKSSTDCLIRTIQGEGFMSLYKGFMPTWMRMAPWSLVFWLTYEQIRRLCGNSSF